MDILDIDSINEETAHGTYGVSTCYSPLVQIIVETWKHGDIEITTRWLETLRRRKKLYMARQLQ